MPDITTSNWFPILTLLLGYATKSLSDWLEYRRNTRREREAREAVRRDKLFEQRTDFQRQTLLDLQEACMQLARSVGAIHHQDEMAFRSTKKWCKQLLSDDLDEGNRLAQARTGMLGARVRDETIRELIDKFKTYSAEAIDSPTPNDSERAVISMTVVFAELNQRIGEVLRKLDDDTE
jgi:hypothetical protein